jgi:putative transposase
MESFWARLQVELLNTRKWATTFELAGAIADYIDNFLLWTSAYSVPQLA